MARTGAPHGRAYSPTSNWSLDQEDKAKSSDFSDIWQVIRPGGKGETIRFLRHLAGYSTWRKRRNHQVSPTSDSHQIRWSAFLRSR
jgi:hypothetical protein